MILQNPLTQRYVSEAAGLADRVQETAHDLIFRYEAERVAHAELQTAKQIFDEQMDSAIAEADMEASVAKTGPLGGLARTSEAYKVAVRKLRADLCAGELRAVHVRLCHAEAKYRDASQEYESAKIRHGSVKLVSELTSSVLRALSA